MCNLATLNGKSFSFRGTPLATIGAQNNEHILIIGSWGSVPSRQTNIVWLPQKPHPLHFAWYFEAPVSSIFPETIEATCPHLLVTEVKNFCPKGIDKRLHLCHYKCQLALIMKQMRQSKKRLTVKAIADYCLVSRVTIRRWIKGGELSALRLPSGHYRVSIADFRDFLERYHMPVREGLFESESEKEGGEK